MFRGIMVSDSDTKFQRIVWREDAGSPVEHYRLLTVTYGLAASPFLAARVLKQLAEDHKWSPDTDEFQIATKLPESCSEPTKRSMLSTTAKIFDPLGLVSPSVVLFKILLQETWCQGVDWDTKLPPTLSDHWKKILSNVRIPRQIAPAGVSIEIHGFADASSSAYAAAVYSRSKLSDDSFVVNLIAAKTRVAPLKRLSIPRLELSAAHLLPKLVTSITTSLTLKIANMYCWSDSEIVLHWLSSPPRRWTLFVCNRTADILDVCPHQHWHHVRSADNPADCASRGVLPTELARHSLWWHGPSWLSSPRSQWPTFGNTTPSNDSHVIIEQRKPPSDIVLCAQDDQPALDKLITKSSTWIRLLRVVAYCQRFIRRCRRSEAEPNPLTNALSARDLKLATNAIVRYCQVNTFREEVCQLKMGQPLKAKSRLLRFTPFLDEVGVLRVGGRIKNAFLPDSVHPC
ncbi:uncharacterized protein LOC118755141 [Rhagoletis pomonella]|uniref:uncharacterized protein LOC118755141 n=1 Tax=Rhagoletis pomonella TaxID=28610 RepID=UPI00177EB726|nr:uncharacterized protein LOC118755141 [Rhagoletis pomonella]